MTTAAAGLSSPLFLSADDEQTLLALRQQFFGPVEIKRVAALDLVAQQQRVAKNFIMPEPKINPGDFSQRLHHYQFEKQPLQITHAPGRDLAALQALIDAHLAESNAANLVQNLEGLYQ